MIQKADIQESLNRSLSGLRANPHLAQRVIRNANRRRQISKKKPAIAVVGLTIVILMVSAMAAGIITQRNPLGLVNWIFSDQAEQTDNDTVPVRQIIFPFDEQNNYYVDSNSQDNSFPEPGFRSDTAEFSNATIAIREVLFDSYGIYMTITAKPSDPNVLLLDYSINPFENSPEDIGCKSDRKGQTVAEWATSRGYQEIMRISLSSPAPAPYTNGRLISTVTYDPESNDRHIVQIDTFQNTRVSGGANFDSYRNKRMQLEDDGTISIMVSGAYSHQDEHQIACTVIPWRITPDGKKDPIIRDIPSRDPDDALLDYDYSEHQVITFSLPAINEKDSNLLAEYKGTVALKDSPDKTAPVTVKLIRTQINVYCVVASRDTGRLYDGISVFLDAEETRLLNPSRLFISSYQLTDDEIIYIQSCDLPEELPAQIYLRWDDYEMDLSQIAVAKKIN